MIVILNTKLTTWKKITLRKYYGILMDDSMSLNEC